MASVKSNNNNNNNNNNTLIYIAPACRMTSEALVQWRFMMAYRDRQGNREARRQLGGALVDWRLGLEASCDTDAHATRQTARRGVVGSSDRYTLVVYLSNRFTFIDIGSIRTRKFKGSRSAGANVAKYFASTFWMVSPRWPHYHWTRISWIHHHQVTWDLQRPFVSTTRFSMILHVEVDRISASVSAPNVDKWALSADIRFRPKAIVPHSVHCGKFGGCRK